MLKTHSEARGLPGPSRCQTWALLEIANTTEAKRCDCSTGHVRAAFAPFQETPFDEIHECRQRHHHQRDDENERHDAGDIEAAAERLDQKAKPLLAAIISPMTAPALQ